MKPNNRGIIRAATPEDFPGYPKYPAKDDIMNRAKRVEGNLTGEALQEMRHPKKSDVIDIIRTPKDVSEVKNTPNESDVTKEDLEALGPKDLSLDMGDDEQALKHRVTPVDFSGKDLDVPGSELDDASESIGSEDEENNSYSLGGDSKEGLEEDQA
jgi:hypothetical protein